jgi:hypothetical protein
MRSALALSVVLAACNPDDGKPTQPIQYLTPDSGEGGAAASNKPLAASCAGNGECDSGVCQIGGSQTWCTLHCTSGADCVPPLLMQCNAKGVCSHP